MLDPNAGNMVLDTVNGRLKLRIIDEDGIVPISDFKVQQFEFAGRRIDLTSPTGAADLQDIFLTGDIPSPVERRRLFTELTDLDLRSPLSFGVSPSVFTREGFSATQRSDLLSLLAQANNSKAAKELLAAAKSDRAGIDLEPFDLEAELAKSAKDVDPLSDQSAARKSLEERKNQTIDDLFKELGAEEV